MPLDVIAIRLGNFLQNSKYEVTYVSNEKKDWFFIQTRRIGKIIPTNLKCLDIIIEGTQEKCKITIGDGKWGKNTPESSNHGKLIPYDGIFSDKKKLFASVISKKVIFNFLDKNV